MPYLTDLEAEVTRLRKLCAETTDGLAVLVSHVVEEKRETLLKIITSLHNAAHGRPFILKSDPKE